MEWLRLHNNTFVWTNCETALLYNSDTGNHMLWSIDSPEIEDFFCTAANPYTLGCIRMDDATSSMAKVQIAHEIAAHNLGRIIPSDEPPVTYPPVLNLQCDPFRVSRNDNVTEALYWNTYLKSVTFFLTGSLRDNDIAKQELYPLEGNASLPLDSALRFIDECIKIGVESISFCTTPGHYPYEAQLWEALQVTPIRKNLFVRANDFTADDLHRLCFFDEITLLYYKDYDTHQITPRSSHPIIKKRFLIENENDYYTCSANNPERPNIPISPIFTGSNTHFFYNNVLLSHSEILGQKLDKRIIFARQRANLNHFGFLSILPDGHVYSNLFEQPIGTVEDHIQTIIAKEMNSNKGWLETRDGIPCRNCLCRWLCPSPTAYERLMGHPACLEGTIITATRH